MSDETFSAEGGNNKVAVREQGVQGFNDDVDADDLQIVVGKKEMGMGFVLGPDDKIVNSGEDGRPITIKRLVTRTKEIPYEEKTKVQIVKQKVVPTEQEHQVTTQKLVEVTEWEDVEDTYTVFEEQKRTRKQMIWVQEEVEEKYMKTVPVKKTKIIKRPRSEVQEQDDFQLICIEGTKMIDVKGWRIDAIERKKVVETEEWEIFELIPHLTDEVIQGEEIDQGRVESQMFRYTGDKVYARGDMADSGIDWDAIPDDDYTELEQDARQRLYINSRGGVTHADPESVAGYTSLKDWNAKFQDVEQFDLIKCLDHVVDYLVKARADVDPYSFREDLKERWQFIDADSSGRVSLFELRTAVWEREEDNAGLPMPNGRFARALQDIVDQIFKGCGSKDPLSFWDFTNYLLGPEEQMVGVVVPTPGPECAWAHAPEEGHHEL